MRRARIFAQVVQGERLAPYESVRMTTQGQRLLVITTLSQVLDSNGQIKGVSRISRDVTAIRAAEEDQAFLAAIVQTERNAIIGLSLGDTIRSWNPSAQALYGYSAQEAIGESMLMLVPPEMRDEEARIFAQVVQGEKVNPYESVRVAKNGERLLVMTTVAAVLNAEGKVIGVSRISQDIRAIRAAEHQIQQLNNDLQQQLRHVTSLREIDHSIASER